MSTNDPARGPAAGAGLSRPDDDRHHRLELETLYRTAPVGLCLVDRSFRYLRANEALAKIHGVPVEGIVGRTVRECLPAQADAIEAAIERVFRTGEAVLADEVRRFDAGRGPSVYLIDRIPLLGEGGEVVGVHMHILDITEQRRAELARRASEERLRTLANELVLAEERERRRLAEGLHEGCAQLLTAAAFKVGAIRRDAPALETRLHEISELLQEAQRQARTLSFELSPPVLYDGGLSPALRWLAGDLRERFALEVELDDRLAGGAIDERTSVILFRAVRELLVNVVKHARVGRARVQAGLEDGGAAVAVEVTDEGRGFDGADLTGSGEGGFGLLSLRERVCDLGGRMEVRSAKDEGTSVSIVVPVARPADEAPR